MAKPHCITIGRNNNRRATRRSARASEDGEGHVVYLARQFASTSLHYLHESLTVPQSPAPSPAVCPLNFDIWALASAIRLSSPPCLQESPTVSIVSLPVSTNLYESLVSPNSTNPTNPTDSVNSVSHLWNVSLLISTSLYESLVCPNSTSSTNPTNPTNSMNSTYSTNSPTRHFLLVRMKNPC
jgi:hypothetical protein